MRFHIPRLNFSKSIHFHDLPKPYRRVLKNAELSNIGGKRFLGGLPESHISHLIKKGMFDTLIKQYNKLKHGKFAKSKIFAEDYTKQFGNIKNKHDFERLYKSNKEFKKVITKIEKGAKYNNGKIFVYGAVITLSSISGGAYIYNKIEQYREEMIGCFKNIITDREIIKCKIIKASCDNPKIGSMVNKCNTETLPSTLKQADCGSQTSGCVNCDGWDETNENIFYECNEDYTFNQALSDIVVAIGDDVVDAAAGLGKYIWYIISVVIFVLCVIIGWFVVRSMKNITDSLVSD